MRYIFGLPGEELRDVLFSLKDSNVQFVTTRHEQGSAFMADVYGRLTGSAGVCMSTLGPGATNLVTGIADANLDHAPLVAITAQGSLRRLHKESHQIIDIVGMFRPITKWNAQITTAGIVPEVVRKAFKVAEMEKPGATHLEFPEDIALHETDAALLRREKLRRAAPDYKAINAAIALIESSERPLILAGNGAIRKRASNQLRQLVEKTGIPVVSTFMGKGAVSDRSAHSLMSIGLGAPPGIYDIFDEADLVITVGYDVAEIDPERWNRGKKLLHIDFSPAEVYQHYQPDIEVVADISNTLWTLNAAVRKEFDFPRARSYRAWLEKNVLQYANDSVPVHPKQALISLRSAIEDDAIVISDVGAHKMWIGSAFPAHERGTVIISNGFASMGIALPGAIGARLAEPDKDVIAVAGDGGFLMNVQELETAARLKSDFVVVVFNDNCYSLVDAKFRANKGSSVSTEIGNPDLALLAKSFGCSYFRAAAAHELESVYREALAAKGVRIVDVPVDKDVNGELFKE